MGIIGWIAYACFEIALHGFVRSKVVCSDRRFVCENSFKPYRYLSLMWLLSSGWSAAHVYKKGMCKQARAQYIKCCNGWNLGISLVFFTYSITLCLLEPLVALGFPWLKFWVALCFWRFISRSVEITWAFTKDAIRNPIYRTDRSTLNKYDRLKLALFSYVEILLYSAAFYALLYRLEEGMDSLQAMYQAITASLSIGTLTNVGPYVKALDSGYWMWLPFVQVIATLSLVVLSLAMYASRKH